MKSLALEFLKEPIMAVLLVISVGIVLYLAGDAIRQFRVQRKQQSSRQKQRREFWGYE